jgi:MFS family permease
MQTDLGMTDVQWSAGISMFYVGYMVTQLPGVLLLSRGKPRIIMPLMVVAWSLPTILFPLVKNAPGFILARLAVGIAEGAFFPGIALMTSSWYTRDELPFRMALWHGAPCLS